MSVRFVRALVASVAAFALVASAAFAQQPIPQQPVIQPGPAPIVQPAPAVQPIPADQAVPADQAPTGQPLARGQVTDDLTQLLIAANRNEIDVSRFGQDRAQSDQVREFAKNMINEHSDFVNKLQQAAGAAGPEAAAPAAPGVAPAPGGPVAAGPAAELVQMLGQAGNRQVDLIKQELSNKQGIEFDQAFMGNEIASHITMLAALQTAANNTTGQLQQVVSQGVETTQRHLDHARNIMQQLEQARVQQAGKPEETKQR